jgi:hypothetical protein
MALCPVRGGYYYDGRFGGGGGGAARTDLGRGSLGAGVCSVHGADTGRGGSRTPEWARLGHAGHGSRP